MKRLKWGWTKLKFNVTEIFFDVDDSNYEDITLEEYNEIVQNSLGVWEADDEDDLIEEITEASGWCIKSIDYDIQFNEEEPVNYYQGA